jgi:solute carrier family 25 carnitine/acylcarnitine transporter 20/29
MTQTSPTRHCRPRILTNSAQILPLLVIAHKRLDENKGSEKRNNIDILSRFQLLAHFILRIYPLGNMMAQKSHRDEHTSAVSIRRSPSALAREACSSSSALNSAAAGYVAGITGVLMGHPLDSAKVWLQTNSMGRNKHLSQPTSSSNISSSSASFMNKSASGLARSAARVPSSGVASMSTLSKVPAENMQMLKNSIRTLRALYSGIAVPLVSVGLIQSANFASYDALRRILHRYDNPGALETDYLNNDSLTNVAVAGSLTGGVLAFVTGPLIMVKTKQQITGNGFRQALVESVRPNGGAISLSRCYIGFWPHLLSETLGRAVYYTSYEGCKRAIVDYKTRNGHQDTSVAMSERMVSAGVSGIICWSMIFPLDSIRSRMYNQEGLQTKSTMEMIHSMYQEGGSSFRPFYRGFGLTVLRAGPVAAAVLPIYDYMLQKLSSS